MKRDKVLFSFLLGALGASLFFNFYFLCSDSERLGSVADRESSISCSLMQTIELTPEQQRRIEEICADCCEQDGDTTVRMRNAQQELRNALEAPTLDRERIQTLTDALADIQRRCLRENVESALLVREILRPDQIDALLSCCPSSEVQSGQKE